MVMTERIRVKAKRKEIGLTQEQVACEADISVRTYKMYESGVRTPKANIAIRIADAIGVKSYKDFKELFG